MPTSLPKRLITIKRWTAEQMATRIGLIVSVALVVLGGVAAVFFQSATRESVDPRRDASVDQGQVQVRLMPSASPFMYGQPGTIDFQINTNGVQTDGVQLVFNMITPPLTDPLLQIVPASGLEEAYLEMETTSDGYLVGLIAVPDQIGSSFSSTSFVTFARLSFSPPAGGLLNFAFDQGNSLSTVHSSNPPRDELATLANPTFSFIHGDPGPTTSPTPIPTATPVPTANPTPTATPIATATPAPTNNPNPTATPTATPSYILNDFFFPALNDQNGVFWFYEVGTRNGVSAVELIPGRNYSFDLPYVVQNTYKTGNTENGNVVMAITLNGTSLAAVDIPYSSIRGNAAGHRATLSPIVFTAQPTNTFRVTIDPQNQWVENNEQNNSFERSYTYYTGQGGTTYLSCNQNCSSNSQCAPNFRCYQSRCRLVTNVSSESCSAATTNTASTTQVSAACNVSCDANNDCAVNYRCYSNKCRLATNPTSATCSTANTSTVSTIYSNQTKGGLGGNGSNTDGTGTATSSAATPRPASTAKPVASASPIGMVSPTPNPTAFNDITSWFTNIFNSDGTNEVNWLSLPVALMVAGSILLLIIILIIVARLLGRRSSSGPVVPTKQNPTVYEHSLQQRISELQSARTAQVRPNMPSAPVVPPVASTAPIAPATPIVPRATAPMTPPPSTLQPTMPGTNTPNSMLDRMKQKGVTTPGGE